ncbi:YkvA family protein [Dechloromonas sp. H13]|uniref:YkvA family protein n=1 Tax=Dechloromonas sp. H13 TaxID=2570193 RepID=UPI001291C9AE|nr:YkvA family protein [Dechloromonas sp. H13]
MEKDKLDFAKDYSETGFWDKVRDAAKTAGKEVIGKGLQCYYTIQKPETPAWAKGTLIAALGYFISPIDAIPDFTPMIGYADDLGVLTIALATVATHITDDVKAKAEAKLIDWFGA